MACIYILVPEAHACSLKCRHRYIIVSIVLIAGLGLVDRPVPVPPGT